jgi:hypothetical protein
MAWYAQIGTNNTVEQILFVSDTHDIHWVEQTYGGNWIEAFENGGTRKNFPSKNYTYDSELDAFLPPKPFLSWVLNSKKYNWEAPTPYPKDGQLYKWNEETISWEEVTL